MTLRPLFLAARDSFDGLGCCGQGVFDQIGGFGKMGTKTMKTKPEARGTESEVEARAEVLRSGDRRRILLAVRDRGPIAPSELVDDLGIELGKLSYNFRVLRDNGFIEVVRTEPVRGALKSYYVATERHLIETPDWQKLDRFQKQLALGETFAPVVDDFNRAAAGGTFGDDGRFHVWRTPIRALDQEGLDELLEIHRQLSEAADDVTARAAERMGRSGEASISVTSASQCFRVPGF